MTGRPAAGHPYSKLLEELDGARFIRFDKAKGRVLAWHGGKRVDVFNLEGALSDFFTLKGDETTADAAAGVIDAWLAEEEED